MKKNQLVYPLHNRVNNLLTDVRNINEKYHRKMLRENIDAMDAHIQHIEDLWVRIKDILQDLCPSVQTHLETLEQLSDSQHLNSSPKKL